MTTSPIAYGKDSSRPLLLQLLVKIRPQSQSVSGSPLGARLIFFVQRYDVRACEVRFPITETSWR